MVSRGTVIDATESHVVLLEFDFVEGQDMEVVYGVDDQTELIDLEDVEDLEEGDFVEIVYEDDGDVKSASRITRK